MNIQDVIQFLKIEKYVINNHVEILSVGSILNGNIRTNDISWCAENNKDFLPQQSTGTFIITQDTFDYLSSHTFDFQFNILIHENPRFAFSQIIQNFFVKKEIFGKIHSSSIIDDSVSFNPDQVNIAPNVVIESGVIIGSNVSIGANTVIKNDTIIGNDVKIGSNCTIGGVGFGYVPNEEGIYELIPHLGNVQLANKVEIGNNVCVDRALIGSTFLDEEVKVDNLVHIAHGVQIGKNSLIIAHAMIAGSVKIGENTWVAPCASIKNKLTVGDNALIGLGSVVVKNVNDNEIVAGVPAKKMN